MHKLSCTRQFENKFSLRSLVSTLHKLSCTRQFENKFSLHSLVSTLHKLSCTRQFENKFSLRSLVAALHKLSCTRQFENKRLVHRQTTTRHKPRLNPQTQTCGGGSWVHWLSIPMASNATCRRHQSKGNVGFARHSPNAR